MNSVSILGKDRLRDRQMEENLKLPSNPKQSDMDFEETQDTEETENFKDLNEIKNSQLFQQSGNDSFQTAHDFELSDIL